MSITGEDLRSVAMQILQKCVIEENAGGGWLHVSSAFELPDAHSFPNLLLPFYV